MKMIKISAFSLCLLPAVFLSSCFVKKAVVPVTETIITPLGDKHTVTDGTLVYALPMSLFTITAEFERTIEKPGPYAKFAGDMLGLKDIIYSERESWKIKTITVELNEEIDPSEYYVIESNTLVQTNALALKKAGLILDLNPEKYGDGKRIIDGSRGLERQLAFTDMGANEYYITRSDTAYRLVKLDTTFIRIPYLVERKKTLTLEQLAERAAKTLLELREGRHLILTGEANVYPQSNAGLDEINKIEKEYIALFAGKTATETRIARYIFIPQRENTGKPNVLFRFSESMGPSDSGSNAGIPVTIETEPAGKTKDITYITKPQMKEGETTKTYDKLFYRPPEVVTLRIKYGNETIYESRKLVYQLGEVLQLPANYIIGK